MLFLLQSQQPTLKREREERKRKISEREESDKRESKESDKREREGALTCPLVSVDHSVYAGCGSLLFHQHDASLAGFQRQFADIIRFAELELSRYTH